MSSPSPAERRRQAETILRARVAALAKAEAEVERERVKLGREVILLNERWNLSVRLIAEIAGVSHVTVLKWKKKGVSDGV